MVWLISCRAPVEEATKRSSWVNCRKAASRRKPQAPPKTKTTNRARTSSSPTSITHVTAAVIRIPRLLTTVFTAMKPTTTTVAAVVPTAGTTRLTPLSATDVAFTGGFWADRTATNRSATIPAGFRQLQAAGTLHNFELAAAQARSGYRAIGINTFVGLWRGPTEEQLDALDR